jgi:hypothetical protein
MMYIYTCIYICVCVYIYIYIHLSCLCISRQNMNAYLMTKVPLRTSSAMTVSFQITDTAYINMCCGTAHAYTRLIETPRRRQDTCMCVCVCVNKNRYIRHQHTIHAQRSFIDMVGALQNIFVRVGIKTC